MIMGSVEMVAEPLMSDQSPITRTDGYSALERIRSAETEVARRTAAARETGERLITTTQQQAADLKREAEEKGRQEGQTQYAEAISKAQEAAQTMLVQANQQADEFRHRAEDRMDSLIRAVIKIVIGTGEDDS